MVFVTIYQHNSLIKLNYEKQRLVLKERKLDKERNEFMVELCSLRDFGKARLCAQEKWNMAPLALSNMLTLTRT